MSQYNIAEAKAHFSELIKRALLGEEIWIARDNKPLIKLTPIDKKKKNRTPGSAKGQIRYIAPDFDNPGEDFKEYM
jgi:prevent-host-death family protein